MSERSASDRPAGERAGLRVAPLRPEQLRACGEIVASNALFARYGYGAAAAERQLQGALADPRAELVVALDDRDAVVGFAWVILRAVFDRSSYLRLIAVDARRRRCGAGRLLLAYLEQRHLVPGGIALLVTADNTAAQRFYEALGYRHVGDLPGYVVAGVDERIYLKAAP